MEETHPQPKSLINKISREKHVLVLSPLIGFKEIKQLIFRTLAVCFFLFDCGWAARTWAQKAFNSVGETLGKWGKDP